MSRTLMFVVNHAGFFLSHRLPLAIAARDRGWVVRVATPPSKHVPAIREHGLDWHPVRLTRSGKSVSGEIRALLDLRRLYRRLRPDVVHHVTTKPVLWGTLAARLEKVPVVVNALAGLGHLSLAADPLHRLISKAVLAGFRLTLRHPRMVVVFQNEADRAAFVDPGILSHSQTFLIPGSGVDTGEFRPASHMSDGPVTTVLPSRMLYSKGVGEFVGAARVLRERGESLRFVLVGEPDPDNPASIPVDVLRGWENEGIVECWGRRTDMPEVYAKADIVCLPSYREGMPKVLLEAAACGLPAVTTDVPGCRDVVVDGVTGFIVPVRDGGVELARALLTLAGDSDLRRTMGEAARRRVCEHFSLEKIVGMTLDLYERLCR